MAAPKKNARRLKATLVFVDESGFSLLPTACRTWSPRGQTPILRHCFNWPKLSAISAVTPNPHAYLHLVPGTIASREVIRFVRHLLRWVLLALSLFSALSTYLCRASLVLISVPLCLGGLLTAGREARSQPPRSRW